MVTLLECNMVICVKNYSSSNYPNSRTLSRENHLKEGEVICVIMFIGTLCIVEEN